MSSVGLTAADFQNVACNGFGDPQNSYAHAMCWYRDSLYVATTRNGMCAPKPFFEELKQGLSVYPIKVPDTSPWDNDFRAHIWRYDPSRDEWTRLHQSAMWITPDGLEVPRQVGFRCMTLFQAPGDPEPVPYAVSWSSRKGPGPIIMRYDDDGGCFEEITEPGLGGLTSQGIRGLISFKGRLFVATTHKGGSRDVWPDPLAVYEWEDPRSGRWTLACEPFLGDLRNLTVYEMCTFNGFLYAGTFNPYQGCELWKTDAEGRPPYRWQRVLEHGAYRGKLNETIISMCEFNGCLYVGTAIQNCGNDRIFNVGPAAPELIRVHRDDSWDLIVGEPRDTPEGLKVPLSGLTPGFSFPGAGYMWRICEHDGWLYVTTADRTTFLRYASPDVLPSRMRNVLDERSIELLLRQFGGFDMWRTKNGVQWTPVTRNGFGNPYNLGGRTMVSTPWGLFVGTANLFGPEVAVRRAAGWVYQYNQSGGAEVWLGARRSTQDAAAGEHRLSGRLRADFPSHTSVDSDVARVIDEYFGHTGYQHCGYWTPWTQTPREACHNLVEELYALTQRPARLYVPVPSTDEEDRRFILSRMAQKENSRRHDAVSRTTVLDIDCGEGATTRALERLLMPLRITGITSDGKKLRRCRHNAPSARFLRMKLPRLKFPPASFDYVFCVEGLGRHAPGKRLLQEVYRVLKPEGYLAGSVILESENELMPDPVDTYTTWLTRIGYEQVKVLDRTEECLLGFRRHLYPYLMHWVSESMRTMERLAAIQASLPRGASDGDRYLLVVARKPE